MEHLENHPYAFIDSENIVINVAIFSEHDDSLVNDIKISQEEIFEKSLQAVNCCIEGKANVGDKFLGNGNGFLETQPYPSWTLNEAGNSWNPPSPCPTTPLEYFWSETDLTWHKF